MLKDVPGKYFVEFWVRLEYPILATGLYKRVRWLVLNSGLEGIFHVYSNLRGGF
jgi:hypothetical protein